MRKPTQLRLVFLVTALSSYLLGSYLMPDSMGQITSLSAFYKSLAQLNEQAWRLGIATGLFFVVVPFAYWLLVIKASSQAKWKILIIVSLSSLVARYQYPPELAQYFEFIAWLRYPFIAILIALESYLIFSVVRSIWQARKQAGDPRIKILLNFDEGSKQREIGLMLAYEPAAWYYAIPKFSSNHVKSVAQLRLLSATLRHFVPILFFSISCMFISYLLLIDWSALAAIVASSVFFSGTFMVIANYRCSKYHSIYISDGRLVINNSWWGFMVIKLADIAHAMEIKEEQASAELRLGRGNANLRLSFDKGQIYYSALAQISEKVSKVELCLQDPKRFIAGLKPPS